MSSAVKPVLYRYTESLDGKLRHHAPSTIRVLKVTSAAPIAAYTSSTQFVCELELVDTDNIAEREQFEALPYTWGTGEPTQPIILHNKIFLISRNLEIVLQHLVKPGKTRRLWIDAICLNQADVTEKSHQVRMMTQIYKKASRVLVWLGPEEHDSTRALGYLRILGGQLVKIYSEHGFSHRMFREPHPEGGAKRANARLNLLMNEIMERLKDIGYEEERWLKPINELLRRQWWSRAWVRQEVISPKIALVVCGEAFVDWNTLANGLMLLTFRSDMGVRDRRWNESIGAGEQWQTFETLVRNHVLNLIVLRDNTQHSPLTGLDYRDVVQHLTITDFPGCTDDRDRVFAFVGLANNLSPEAPTLWNIVPDYQLDAQEVYTRSTRALIDVSWDTPEDCLRILTFCQGRKNMEGLPSWVPDWTTVFQPNIAGYFGEQIYTADYTILPSKLGFAREVLFRDEKTLALPGCQFDTVFEVGRSYDEISDNRRPRVDGNDTTWTPDGDIAYRWMTSCVDIFSFKPGKYKSAAETGDLEISCMRSGSYPYSQAVEERWSNIAKTLILDRALSHPSISEYYGPEFARREDNNRAAKLEERMFDVWRGVADVPEGFRSMNNATGKPRAGEFISEYALAVCKAAQGRRAVITENGFIGLVPENTMPGDLLIVFFGGCIPFVIREHGMHHELIGGCYIHGVMDGEMCNGNPYPLEIFELQ